MEWNGFMLVFGSDKNEKMKWFGILFSSEIARCNEKQPKYDVFSPNQDQQRQIEA
jgi:hypothetical protein